MKKSFVKLLVVGLLSVGAVSTAHAVDQTVPGAGNAEAVRIASSSGLVQSALRFIDGRIDKISDHVLATNVRDLVQNRFVCIRHRAGETAVSKQAVINGLSTAGLFSATDAAAFPGGALAGVLPPVLQPGSGCPHLPQPFFSAPGSVFGGHHSYPGGLPIHETFNDLSDDSFASNYRRVYGNSGLNGLAQVGGDEDHDGHSFGPIKRSLIVGEAWIRYWPPQDANVIPHPDYQVTATPTPVP